MSLAKFVFRGFIGLLSIMQQPILPQRKDGIKKWVYINMCVCVCVCARVWYTAL